MKAPIPPYWHWVALVSVIIWAAVFRVRTTWRTHVMAALVVAWAAALLSWSVGLEPPVGTVTGRVVSARSHQPLVQARVYLPDGHAWVRTDASGAFTMHAVPVGKAQRITVRARGYETAYDEVEVRESKETAGVLFRMTPREPSFNLYNSERVFRASETPSINISGALLTDFTVEMYRLDAYRDRIDVTDPYKRKALAERLGREENAIYAMHHAVSLDADGDFDDQLRLPSQQNGLYFVRVVSDADAQVRTAWFLVTDLGVVTRRSPHELLVYCQDLTTGAPVAGAIVEFFDGARIVRKATSGRDGTFLWKAPGAQALSVVAQRADSYAYGRLDSLSGADGAHAFRVYLYSDRPIYRPGHAVHVRGIVRRDTDRVYSIPEGAPVRLRVEDARGQTIFTQMGKVGPFGGFDADLTLGAHAALGDYTISADVGGASGHAWFKVAAYRKPEFAVSLKAEHDRYTVGDAVRVRVDARYFFGAPVVPAQVTYTVFESLYRSDRAAFLDLADGEQPEHYGGMVAEGKVDLDADGSAWITFTPDRATHDRSYWIEAEVTDPSQRTVNASLDVRVTLGDLWIDASTDRWGVASGQPVRIDAVIRSFDADAPCAAVSVHASLLRLDYVEKTVKGVSTMERMETEVWKGDATSDAHGALSWSVTPPEDGAYELRLSCSDARGNAITQTLWVFVSGSASSTRVYGSRDLSVLLDRPAFSPGDTARVVVTSRQPNATVLLSVDGRRIHDYRVLTLRGTSVTVELPVPASYFPNVVITALMVRDKALLVDEKPLRVDTVDHGLKVEIRPEQAVYAPGDTVRASVRVTDALGRPADAELSLGVVDAAIYTLAPDSTEKIDAFFYGEEPSYVRTEYSFAPDYSGGRSKEDDPRVRRNFKDTAWWAPALRTGDDGEAEVSFPLPDNITAWRFTARAIDRQHRVGEATQEIVSRKPLLVRLEVPRFLVERDRIELSAVVHNETDQTQAVEAVMRAEGVRLSGGPQSASMAARSVRRFAWTVEAERAGTANVSVTVNGQGASDAMELAVPVLAHGVARLQSGAGQATPESHWTAIVPPDAAVAQTHLTVYLSPSLAATALQGLDYLTAYPYGCTEQTMSAFIPDIVVARALQQLGLRDAQLEKRLPDMIARGLEKIYDLQHADGGWGWWKDDATSPYVTAYVMNGLHLASSNGIEVRQDVWRRGLAALQKLAAEDVGEFREGSGEVRQRTLWSVKAYELAVLDRIGQDVQTMARAVQRHEDDLPVQTQALLAQTLWRVGEKARAEALLEKIRTRVDETETQAHWESKTLGYGWTDDPVETTAEVLRATLMIDPQSPQIDRIVRWLVAYRKGPGWSHTRDTAAAVDVLVDVLLARKGERVTAGVAEVLVNGREAARVAIDGPLLGSRGVVEVPAALLKAGENTVTVRIRGGRALSWAATLETFATGEVEVPDDRGLAVSRSYAVVETRKDDKGRVSATPVPLAAGVAAPLGARVRVTVTVKNARPLSYVAISDMLVPGCELVEGEADRNTRGPWWIGREVHDDRISVFASRLEPGTHVLTYEVRAEAPGTWHVRPAEAFLMYSPEVRGTSAESMFSVRDGGGAP